MTILKECIIMSKKTNKVLVLGIDGLDPRLTKRYLDEGKMPNTQKFMALGAARADLEMIGGHPTVTPPMWTTMATGANPSTHGITDYFRRTEDLEIVGYNFDSTLCRAEPMWNVTAEAGLKTLVWHWPGSSWPPTSDNPNLFVVDGTQPGGPNIGTAEVESELLLVASTQTEEVLFRNKAASDSEVPCFITGMEIEDNHEISSYDKVHSKEVKSISITREQGRANLSETPFDIVFSPIKPAKGWAEAPVEALECTLLLSKGLLRRPCQVLANAAGQYDRLAIYKSKKDTKPLAILEKDVYVADIIDEAVKGDERLSVNRNMRLLDIAADGSSLRLWVSSAMDYNNDAVWHPKSLLKEITANVGYPQPICLAGGSDERLISKCMKATWDRAGKWNAESIKYLAQAHDFDVIYSHFHNVDMQEHRFIRFMTKGDKEYDKEFGAREEEQYRKFLDDVYMQTDRYLGSFLHLLDEGWTIIITSDHAQVCPAHRPPLIGDMSVNVRVMQQLGYTNLKVDENGNELREIDWERTRAVAVRECNIYINLKGRDPHGIVDPKDKYELEEQIMTDLYSVKDEKTGHRVIALALRNKDAVLLGYGGPECGDICYWIAEGYNIDHADGLSTTEGDCETSLSPIFVAAGQGIKQGYTTDRWVRQIDVTPTIAALMNVRMPAQCEGAPVYQIFDQEF